MMSLSTISPTKSNAARAPRGVIVTIRPRIQADDSIVLSDRGWRYARRASMPILSALIALVLFIVSPPSKLPAHMDLYIAGALVVMLVYALIQWRASDMVTLDALSGTVKWVRRRGIHARYAEYPMNDVAVVSCRVQWDQGTRRDKWRQPIDLGLADISGVAIVAGDNAMLLKGSHDANEIHAYLDSLPEPLKSLERAEPWLIAIE
ncbi:MAG: hypothetical protein KF838_14700 [Phycisphaeraceae bacterium]|nr:MAG: hypothetical protein KF838_14700 [Phycisphaeraceae bacterium]